MVLGLLDLENMAFTQTDSGTKSLESHLSWPQVSAAFKVGSTEDTDLASEPFTPSAWEANRCEIGASLDGLHSEILSPKRKKE